MVNANTLQPYALRWWLSRGVLKNFSYGVFHCKEYRGVLFTKYTATLYISGYNLFRNKAPMARILFFITPPKRSALLFWFYVYGAEGSMRTPLPSKYFIITGFCVIILLLYSITVGFILYWVFIMVKK